MITKKLFQFILIAIVTLFIQVPTQAATCNKSYTLGFFNGVWNTFGEASEGASKLKDIIGPTYNNEPVKYEPFYNHTAPGYDVLGLQDVAETFIQRSAEIDASGELGKRFEYFWEFIGSSEPTFIDKIKGIFSNAISLFESLYTAVNTKLVAIISYFTSNPPTEADYATHNARLDALAADGQKLMLVGHSQGNLFMNHGYDHILPTVGADRVAAAHIAPASPTLRGDYVLANIDLVINILRIQGASSVPDNNLDINASRVDVSGHTLIGTYLDPARDGRGRIKTMIETGMGGLKCPVRAIIKVTKIQNSGIVGISSVSYSFKIVTKLKFVNGLYYDDEFIEFTTPVIQMGYHDPNLGYDPMSNYFYPPFDTYPYKRLSYPVDFSNTIYTFSPHFFPYIPPEYLKYFQINYTHFEYIHFTNQYADDIDAHYLYISSPLKDYL